MSVPSPKQIILLLDGTWNDADEDDCDTNIVRIRELINHSLENAPVTASSSGFAESRKFKADQKLRLVYYERGVGTGPPWDQFAGGVFGAGLSENVRRAYRFLSWYYEPADEIFVFGFSRGAYTARSLIGLIGCAGLLRRESCTAAREAMAWGHYRTAVNDRLPEKFDRLTEYVHDRAKFRIKCLGVFDTVGALGVPLPIFRRTNRENYGFHDVEIGSITECNFHAIAIDEHREPFQATLWQKPKFKAFDPQMTNEQVWFVGAHADIGGGYMPETKSSLHDITLYWMLNRVRHKFPDFPIRFGDPTVWRHELDEDCCLAPLHDSRSIEYFARPYVHRSINNQPGPTRVVGRHAPYLLKDRFVGYDRHAEPLNERIHISVLHRLGKAAPFGRRKPIYAPLNVLEILPQISATYSVPPDINNSRSIFVVDWDGMLLSNEVETERQTVLELLGNDDIKQLIRKST